MSRDFPPNQPRCPGGCVSFDTPFTAKRTGVEYKKCLTCLNVKPVHDDAPRQSRTTIAPPPVPSRESLDAALLLKLLDMVKEIHAAVVLNSSNKRARTEESEN
jgi:hypothetical protein